jgi:hypothetical protein
MTLSPPNAHPLNEFVEALAFRRRRVDHVPKLQIGQIPKQKHGSHDATQFRGHAEISEFLGHCSAKYSFGYADWAEFTDSDNPKSGSWR